MNRSKNIFWVFSAAILTYNADRDDSGAPPVFLYIAEITRNSRWTLPTEAGGRPSQDYMKTKTTTTVIFVSSISANI